MSTLVRNHIKNDLETQLVAQFEVRKLDDQQLLITPLLYPDSSHVNLYVEELAEGRIAVTDNGEAADYVWVLGVSETAIEDRVRRARRQFRLLSVDDDGLRFEGSRDHLAEAIFDVAAAVQDVASLVYQNRDY
ncbi:MAG: DUF1828 domain-containing protein [Thermomicrobiales bacterium]|nr:DUF1828 domain-containing protein [Thermomicrobiales bacterium]